MSSSKDVDFLKSFFLDANRRKVVKTECEGESLTQQQWKDIVDVNNIVKSMTANAFNRSWFNDLADMVFKDAKRYGDVSNVGDLQQSYQLMEDAKNAFVNNIPSAIRSKFNHDPVAFYKFVADDKNRVAFEAMLRDYSNYVAPSVTQLEEGNNQVVVDAVNSNAAKRNKA